MYILLLKMLHYFHGKIVAKVFITCCAVYVHTYCVLWKDEKCTYSLSHWKKFRQINSLLKPLLSRNFCQKMRESKFPEFPHSAMGGATANVISKGFLSHGTKSFAKRLCKNDLLFLTNNTEIQYILLHFWLGWDTMVPKSRAIIYIFCDIYNSIHTSTMYSCWQENLL